MNGWNLRCTSPVAAIVDNLNVMLIGASIVLL